MASSPSQSSSSEQEEQKKQVVRQFFDAFNGHDTERMAQLVSTATTTYSFHVAGLHTTDWNGRKQFVVDVIKAFPDIDHHILDIVAEGDKVAIRVNITGTHKGEFQGIRATGKKVSVDGTDFLTIIDGKIVEEWLNSDMMGLLQQIGGISTPRSASSGSTSMLAHDRDRSKV
jgi:steroid delta-isomerase-like uncharacterized protein